MVLVVHRHAEDLALVGDRLGAVERAADPPVPSIAAWRAGSANTANTASAGASIRRVTVMVSSLIVDCSRRPDPSVRRASPVQTVHRAELIVHGQQIVADT